MDNIIKCDAAGVSIWRRKGGFAWARMTDLKAGRADRIAGGFKTISAAAADAVATLGL